MNNADPKHLIHHIDSAKTWLDKAKEEYIESNGVGAGMNLNLAQAEVKYAWELSRHQDVSQIDEKPKKEQRHYWMPAAAAFTVFALGTMLSLQLIHIPKTVGKPIAHQPVQPLIKEKIAVVKPLQPKSSDQKLKVGQSAEKVSPLALKGKGSIVASTSKIIKPVTERVPKSQNVPSTVSANSGNEPIKAVASNTTENVRTPESSVTVKIQPASVINIDEEALTREASNSLRLGK